MSTSPPVAQPPKATVTIEIPFPKSHREPLLEAFDAAITYVRTQLSKRRENLNRADFDLAADLFAAQDLVRANKWDEKNEVARVISVIKRIQTQNLNRPTIQKEPFLTPDQVQVLGLLYQHAQDVHKGLIASDEAFHRFAMSAKGGSPRFPEGTTGILISAVLEKEGQAVFELRTLGREKFGIHHFDDWILEVGDQDLLLLDRIKNLKLRRESLCASNIDISSFGDYKSEILIWLDFFKLKSCRLPNDYSEFRK